MLISIYIHGFGRKSPDSSFPFGVQRTAETRRHKSKLRGLLLLTSLTFLPTSSASIVLFYTLSSVVKYAKTVRDISDDDMSPRSSGRCTTYTAVWVGGGGP